MGPDSTDETDDSGVLGSDGRSDRSGVRDVDEQSDSNEDDDEVESASFVWDVEFDDERDDSGTTVGEHETAETTETTETAETVDTAEPIETTHSGSDGTDPTDTTLDRPDDANPTTPRTLDPERYLLAGETIAERVDVRRGWVVATSHRLLVFDPESSGKRFVTVARPNVVDVRTTGGGSQRIQSYAVRAGLYAVVFLAGGAVARGLGLRSLFTASPDIGGTPGVGGLVSTLSLVGTLVGLVVDLLFFTGLAAGLVGLALGVWYVRGRQPTLVVERAGDADLELELPSDAVGRRLVEGLERTFSEELALGRD